MGSVSAKFSSLINRVQPTASELSALEAARRHLTSFLKLKFQTSKFLLMGSHSRDTAISGSDLDMLQVLRKSELTYGGDIVSSYTALRNLRTSLADYAQTEVRRDQQALVIRYKSGKQLDLVPGYYIGPGQSNYPVYAIPDGSGGWLRTSPESHNLYLKLCDERSGGKLKRVVQIIKYWRCCRVNEVPLNSFHLETVLASSGIAEGAKAYSECIKDAFAELHSREGRAIRDPIGISGLIGASSTQAQRDAVTTALSHSANHARNARIAELFSDGTEAIRQWQLVFNGSF
jgi:predicted nucleotidyltransferase